QQERLPFRTHLDLLHAKNGYRREGPLACWIAPDGGHVAVEVAYNQASPRPRHEPIRYTEVGLADRTGSAWRMARRSRPTDALPKSEDGVRARWSPSGRYVLFMAGRSETSIRLHDTKTGDTRILGGNLTFPVAWREDSGRLAMFHVPPTGKSELIEYSVGEK